MLRDLISLASLPNIELDLGLNLEPVERLSWALNDVENGFNNQLLVVGELGNRLLGQRFSERSRSIIQAHAAGNVELLVRHKIVRSQIAAARRVAIALQRGGYTSGLQRGVDPPRPDTIKRWHNRGKKLDALANSLSDENWQSMVSAQDKEYYENYLIIVFYYEPDNVARRARSMYPELADFDPDRELGALERLCRRCRTFD
jgi:hypothetical protein